MLSIYTQYIIFERGLRTCLKNPSTEGSLTPFRITIKQQRQFFRSDLRSVVLDKLE